MEVTIDEALQQGIAAHKAGKPQEAEKLYRLILKSHPRHSDANHNLGVLAVGVGRVQDALPLFKLALEANPKQDQYWLSYIDALIKLDQINDAKQMIQQGETFGLNGEKIDFLKNRLNSSIENPTNLQDKQIDELIALYTQGHPQEAVSLGVALANRFPTNFLIPNILGASYAKLKNYNETINNYNRAIELKPDYAEAYNNFGAALNEFKEYDEAIKRLNKAIEFKSDFAEAHNNLGNALQELNQIEKARESFEKAVQFKPDFAEAYNNLGNTLRELNQFKRAIHNYNIALELKPDYAAAYHNLGTILYKSEEYDEAIKRLNKAIEIQPDFSEAHNNLGRLFKKIGQYEKAIESFNKSIETNPNNLDSYSYLGNLLFGQGKYEESINYYDRALEIKVDLAEAYNNRANVLLELGEEEAAVKNYCKAIVLQPEYGHFHENLGKAFIRKSNFLEAASHLKRCDNDKSQSFLLRCFYRLEDQDRFYEQLDYLLERGVRNPIVGSLACQARHKFGKESNNLFCNNPIGYVLNTNLKDKCDFEAIFVEKGKTILNSEDFQARRQNLLINGRQTPGNIFNFDNKNIESIKRILLLEIDKYRNLFDETNEGFLKNWPEKFDLYGWLISMTSGGELLPHMHETGWISGTVYINVPQKPKSNPEAGNLVVCVDHDLVGENQKKIIDVATGDLCLFPASLLHYTIPFASDEERIVLAFDVVPT